MDINAHIISLETDNLRLLNELEVLRRQIQEKIDDNRSLFNKNADINSRITEVADAIYSFFNDAFEASTDEDDDEISVTLTLDRVNTLLDRLGIANITIEREWEVRLDIGYSGSVRVYAPTKDEAERLVNNATWEIDCSGIDYADLDNYDYNFTVNIDGIERKY